MLSLFVFMAFAFQILLVVHFALRKWRFATAIRYGYLIYLWSVPAELVSLGILMAGKDWSFWVGGFLYLVWGIFGYVVEYRKHIQWRAPILWKIFIPYILLYLATVMFYWFPLALINKLYWYLSGALFLSGTYLNITSHTPPAKGH